MNRFWIVCRDEETLTAMERYPSLAAANRAAEQLATQFQAQFCVLMLVGAIAPLRPAVGWKRIDQVPEMA